MIHTDGKSTKSPGWVTVVDGNLKKKSPNNITH